MPEGQTHGQGQGHGQGDHGHAAAPGPRPSPQALKYLREARHASRKVARLLQELEPLDARSEVFRRVEEELRALPEGTRVTAGRSREEVLRELGRIRDLTFGAGADDRTWLASLLTRDDSDLAD